MAFPRKNAGKTDFVIYNVNTEYESSALLVSVCPTIFHAYATFSYIFGFDEVIIQHNVARIPSAGSFAMNITALPSNEIQIAQFRIG